MNDSAWKGAPRPVGAGRERMEQFNRNRILDHDQDRIKSRRDPDRFQAASLVRVLRLAGLDLAAADVARAYGLRQPVSEPACTCWTGLIRSERLCRTCRNFATGGKS
jgi:hypothetical protein